MSDSAFVLNIAGLQAALISPQPAFARALAQRYAAFGSTDPPAYQVLLHVSYPPPQPRDPMDTGLHWEAYGCRFDAPGFRGRIDLQSGQAELHLASQSPLEEAEYFLRIVYALLAFRAGGVLFHAAGIVHRGAAYLFFGPSGSGKTTVAALSSQARILNDDLVLLMPAEQGWAAHATPFWNPTQVRPSPGQARLQALLRLVQSPQVNLEPLRGGQALAECLACIPVLTTNPAYSPHLIQRARSLLAHAPAYRLYFRKDATFWQTLERSL